MEQMGMTTPRLVTRPGRSALEDTLGEWLNGNHQAELESVRSSWANQLHHAERYYGNWRRLDLEIGTIIDDLHILLEFGQPNRTTLVHLTRLLIDARRTAAGPPNADLHAAENLIDLATQEVIDLTTEEDTEDEEDHHQRAFGNGQY